MASINASLHSSIASLDTITSLADDVSNISRQLQDVNANIATRRAEVEAANTTNAQTALRRDEAVAAVNQVQRALDNLDPTDPSRLEEVRRLISGIQAEYQTADLSGVYQRLMERLVAQRAVREELEAELEGLNGDIEHLRQISSVLPTDCNGRS